MPYNVYLYNGLAISNPLARKTLSATEQTGIQQILKGYFDKVVTAHDNLGRRGQPTYGMSNVQWIKPPFPTIAVHELLVYLVPTDATIVAKGKLEQGRPPAGHDGFTNVIPNPAGTAGSSTGSESYPNFPANAGGLKVLAGIMFHEMMHNKLALGNAQLHNRGGLAIGTPVGFIDENTQLTPNNINEMASALDVARPQWTAGLAILEAAASIPDTDPMKGMY
jgi:hypothetical protein